MPSQAVGVRNSGHRPGGEVNIAGRARGAARIGPVTAQAILAFRSERGTFTSVDELLEVSGIDEPTLHR